MRYLALALALACGGEGTAETVENVNPEPAPSPSEPEPPASAPTLDAIPAASLGRARVAEPFLEQGFTYPMRNLEAGFGKDGNLVLIELKPETDGLSIQLTFHGPAALGTQGYRVLPIAADESDVFTVALGRTNLRPGAGEVHVESVSDDAIVATLDLEVRHPMLPTPTQLRARIHARHDTYYDAAIRHEQAIREQLKRR